MMSFSSCLLKDIILFSLGTNTLSTYRHGADPEPAPLGARTQKKITHRLQSGAMLCDGTI
jgi:hypothetical protein